MILKKKILLRDRRARSERDSSGTTEGQAKRSPKVMERIARRERAKPAKRLAQINIIFTFIAHGSEKNKQIFFEINQLRILHFGLFILLVINVL
jgi:hypothetical protein